MKTILSLGLMLCLLAQACSTTPKTQMGKTVDVANSSVEAAILLYQDSVKAGRVSKDTLPLAQQALETYKNAAVALIEAAKVVNTSDGNSPALQQAFAAFNAAKGDLLAILSRYITKEVK